MKKHLTGHTRISIEERNKLLGIHNRTFSVLKEFWKKDLSAEDHHYAQEAIGYINTEPDIFLYEVNELGHIENYIVPSWYPSTLEKLSEIVERNLRGRSHVRH